VTLHRAIKAKDQSGTRSTARSTRPAIARHITVGASNSYGTTTRSDDTMATFSSHGPSRSFYTRRTARVYDNVIKPDLVAPGNKIVSGKAINNLIASENTLLSIPLSLFETNTDAICI
jgi:subtilisin family serine protease